MNLQDWTNVATISGIIIALCQFYCSRKDNKNNNELENGPDFYFTAPQQCDRFGVGYCSGGDFTPQQIEDCDGTNLVYFFNLVNCGKFAAKDVRICFANEEDSKNILSIADGRWDTIKHHSGFPTGAYNGDLIPLYTKKGDLTLRTDDKRIFILLEYRSSYTNRKYKRVYECCIKDNLDNCVRYDQKNDKGPSFKKMGFNRKVAIHDIRLIDESKKEANNFFSRILVKFRKKLVRIQSLEDWLLDL